MFGYKLLPLWAEGTTEAPYTLVVFWQSVIMATLLSIFCIFFILVKKCEANPKATAEDRALELRLERMEEAVAQRMEGARLKQTAITINRGNEKQNSC